MFDHVKKYIAKGIPVFPCREKDESDGRGNIYKSKTPRTPKGFLDATTEFNICADRWGWNTTKNSAIGMPTGKVSGFTVIDLDRGHKDGNDGVAEWKRLNKEYDTEPADTTVVKTPSGGYHLYYQYEESIKSTNKLAKGIDIKNNGGYVILPPSEIQKGKYEFYNKLKPAKIHNWVLDFFKIEPIIKQDQVIYDIKEKKEILDILNKINPDCDYQDWITVGMALCNWNKDIGCEIWDQWSKNGSKYKAKECFKKWNTFKTAGITIGTLIFLANKKE